MRQCDQSREDVGDAVQSLTNVRIAAVQLPGDRHVSRLLRCNFREPNGLVTGRTGVARCARRRTLQSSYLYDEFACSCPCAHGRRCCSIGPCAPPTLVDGAGCSPACMPISLGTCRCPTRPVGAEARPCCRGLAGQRPHFSRRGLLVEEGCGVAMLSRLMA